MLIEIENVDPEQWMEESFEDSYPWAARHAQWSHGRLLSEFRAPLDILYDRGVINQKQHSAGGFVVKLRIAIGNNLRTERIIQEYTGVEPIENGIGPGKMLRDVLAPLTPYQRQMIDRVCLQRQRQDYGYQHRPLNDNDYRWISHCCGTLKESLDALRFSIDGILKSAKNTHMAVGSSVSTANMSRP